MSTEEERLQGQLQPVDIESSEADSYKKDKWYSLRIGSDPLFSPLSTFFTDVDMKHRILIYAYFTLFIAAYIILHWYFSQPSDPLCDLFANFSASFITIDITFVLVAIAIYVGNEFWDLGFSIYTFILFIIFSFVVGLGIQLPLYLALRVSRQCKVNKNNDDLQIVNKKEISNWQSFIPFTIYIIVNGFFLVGPSPFQEPSVCTD